MIELTRQDRAETLAILAAMCYGQPHAEMEPRHKAALRELLMEREADGGVN